MNLVILASRFPYPLEKGDKLRLYHQIKELSKSHQITLIALSEVRVSTAYLEHLQAFCNKIHVLPLQKGRIAINLLRGFFQGLPLQVSYFYSPYLKRSIQNLINDAQPEHLYCQLIRMAPYAIDLQIPKTLDYQDAFSMGMQRRAERASFWSWLFRLEARRLQQYEQLVAKHFNHCTIISKQDKKWLPVADKRTISIVPNGVDIEFFQPNPGYEKKYDLVFVGNMGYHPNVEAAKFLVKNMLPIIKKILPNIKILIAGARPTAEVKNLANEHVHVSGWMEDIREAYWSAKLFIAPIFLGSGQQNKILEAMACGLPCITTSQVNNAIAASVNDTIFLAEKAEAFAAFAAQLLGDADLRERMSQTARKFVEQQFSWQSATNILENLFRS